MKVINTMAEKPMTAKEQIARIESDIIIEAGLFTHAMDGRDKTAQVIEDLNELYQFWAANDGEFSDSDKVKVGRRVMDLIRFVSSLSELSGSLTRACEAAAKEKTGPQLGSSSLVTA